MTNLTWRVHLDARPASLAGKEVRYILYKKVTRGRERAQDRKPTIHYQTCYYVSESKGFFEAKNWFLMCGFLSLSLRARFAPKGALRRSASLSRSVLSPRIVITILAAASPFAYIHARCSCGIA